MMRGSLRIIRIWGIPIRLHSSWFIIFILITLSLGINYFPMQYPVLSLPGYIVLGILTSLLFFGSVLAHELGHSYIAIRNNIPVKGITLFIFGGIAQIEKEPESPGVEFRIAIAGPVVSLALALLFGLLWILEDVVPILGPPGQYLMRINLILAIFNLVPGFPLDGGRVLRALVWSLTDNYHRATRVATMTGRVVAIGMMGIGVLLMLYGEFLNGVWIIFIGLFLLNAAARTYTQVNLRESLRGMIVSQVMEQDCQEVSHLTTLQEMVDEQKLLGGRRRFYVTEGGQLRGMVSLREISIIPERQWRFITAERVMVPVNRLVQVQPDTDLITALDKMSQAGAEQIAVVEDGELVGTLSRAKVGQFLRSRS